jgi:hypothetical protein
MSLKNAAEFSRELPKCGRNQANFLEPGGGNILRKSLVL